MAAAPCGLRPGCACGLGGGPIRGPGIGAVASLPLASASGLHVYIIYMMVHHDRFDLRDR